MLSPMEPRHFALVHMCSNHALFVCDAVYIALLGIVTTTLVFGSIRYAVAFVQCSLVVAAFCRLLCSPGCMHWHPDMSDVQCAQDLCWTACICTSAASWPVSESEPGSPSIV